MIVNGRNSPQAAGCCLSHDCSHKATPPYLLRASHKQHQYLVSLSWAPLTDEYLSFWYQMQVYAFTNINFYARGLSLLLEHLHDVKTELALKGQVGIEEALTKLFNDLVTAVQRSPMKHVLLPCLGRLYLKQGRAMNTNLLKGLDGKGPEPLEAVPDFLQVAQLHLEAMKADTDSLPTFDDRLCGHINSQDICG
ncbi:hypothetical protein ACJZ2D_013791 [Fusarium nematophilum]